MARIECRLRVWLHFHMDASLQAAVDPEDLLQELWSEIACHLDRFEYRGPGSLQRWMAGILRNKLLHAARKNRRRPIPFSALATDGELAPPQQAIRHALVQSQSGVSRPARLQEMEQQIRACLQKLPEGERQVLLCRLFEGLTGVETAERLAIDPSTVSVRMKRAIAACARHLEALAP